MDHDTIDLNWHFFTLDFSFFTGGHFFAHFKNHSLRSNRLYRGYCISSMNLASANSVFFFFPCRHWVGWAGKQCCHARGLEIKRGVEKKPLACEINITRDYNNPLLLWFVGSHSGAMYVWMCWWNEGILFRQGILVYFTMKKVVFSLVLMFSGDWQQIS